MTAFTPWQAQGLQGRAVIEAQRCWLSQLAETLSARLHQDSSHPAIGECLERLMSGLLQSLVSEEEAYLELGRPADDSHVEAHNQLCMSVLELIKRHERGEPVGLQLLQLLQGWLARHCAQDARLALH
ncbi:hypothetical protein NGA35_02115 [Pseudomonas stutzeri]|nr:hypothetical protein [Stutzerimonas stutzeri]